MKIWTVTYNDDDGTNTDVFNTAAGAEAAAFQWTKVYWDGMRSPTPMPDNRHDALDWLYEQPFFLNSVSVTEHNLLAPEAVGLDAIVVENIRCSDDLEVDNNALVSWGTDPGAFVQTWLWVPFDSIGQEMAIITDKGTVWYFDLFEEFMKALAEMPDTFKWGRGTPELLAKSEGVNDAEEFQRYLNGKI